jgi:hypothetical protein
LAHVLAGAALCGKQRDLDAGVTDQKPQQLRTGVAGRAEYADLGCFSTALGMGHSFSQSNATAGRRGCGRGNQDGAADPHPAARGTITRDRAPVPRRRPLHAACATLAAPRGDGGKKSGGRSSSWPAL